MPLTRDLILRSATAQAGARLEGRRGADARPARGRARGVWKTDGRGGPLGYNHGMSRFPIAWPGVPLALLSAGLFGISMPLAKVLLGEGGSPWLLAGPPLSRFRARPRRSAARAEGRRRGFSRGAIAPRRSALARARRVERRHHRP